VRVAAGVIALGAVLGCSRARVVELADRFDLAEVHREVEQIDFGTAAARRHMVRGWHQDEGPSADGTTFVWSRGRESEVEFLLVRPRVLTARLRCRPYPAPGGERQSITPVLNGTVLDEVELDPGFHEVELPLPEDAQVTGINRLVLRHRFAVSPREIGAGGDWRRLAVAYDRLWLGDGTEPPLPSAEAGDLLLPPATEVSYYLRFEPRMRLRIAAVEPTGGDAPRLTVVVETDSGGDHPVVEAVPGESSLEVPIEGPAGEPFRLVMRSVRSRRSGGSGAIRLKSPRLELAPSPGGRRPATAPPAGTDRPNVIIYLVDALRADRLSLYGHSRPTSPELERFAARATVYSRAFAQSSWTRPAVASLFTGLRPEVHGANRRSDRLGPGPATLAEVLSRAGYQTAAVVSNPNVAADFGFDRGFDHYELTPSDRRGSGEVNRRVARWLDGRDRERPFLLYVHTVDPHLPYDPPPAFRERFAAGVEERDLGTTERVGGLLDRDVDGESGLAGDLLDLYDAEVAANDHSFGRLVDDLRRRRLLAGSMVVFVSDHGEEFYDHGGWIHGRTLYREMLHVPLVIALPGQRRGRIEPAPVEHVDLLPTVLEVAGIEIGTRFDGVSLLGPITRDREIAAFLDHDGWRGSSVLRGRWKAIRIGYAGFPGRPQLYDVERDPDELEDLGAVRGVLAGTLLSEGREEIIDEVGTYEGGAAEIDDELRERLKALGYI